MLRALRGTRRLRRALTAIAIEAISRETGARGLRAILEEIMLDVMYDLPSLPDVARCMIDGETIRGHKQPLLLTKAGLAVEEE